MQPGIQLTKIWSDDHMFELRIVVSDNASEFTNNVYVGNSEVADVVARLISFKDQLHGGLAEIQFGGFGQEYAHGAFHARFHFTKPGRLYITSRQQSDFVDFSTGKVASEATLYLKSEPVLLDNFIEQLKALDARKRENAYQEAI